MFLKGSRSHAGAWERDMQERGNEIAVETREIRFGHDRWPISRIELAVHNGNG